MGISAMSVFDRALLQLRKMPLGIKILAATLTLGALSSLMYSFSFKRTAVISLSQIDMLLFAATTTFAFLVAAGLWMLRKWAPYVYIVHLCLNVGILYSQGMLPYNKAAIIGVILQMLLIMYLLLWPKARAALR